MRQLLPATTSGMDELGDDDLAALYSWPDRSTPLLRLNFVCSIDGAMTVDGVSGGLSGPDDKRVFELLRREADALLLGAGTLRREGYGPLVLDAAGQDARATRGLPPAPTLAVVSGRLDQLPGHPALTEAPVRPIVITHAGADPEGRAAIAEVADVIATGIRGVDIAAALDALAERGLRHVLCEGGPTLFGALLAADRVDELCLTVAPLLVGSEGGRIISGEPLPAVRMALAHILSGSGSLLLRYVRERDVGHGPAYLGGSR